MFVTWVRLSPEMTVLGSDGDLEWRVNQVVGKSFFDVWPEADGLMREGFEKTLRHGHHNFACMYHECVVAVLCTRTDEGLLVCFKTLPLAGLTESLAAVEAALTEPQQES